MIQFLAMLLLLALPLSAGAATYSWTDESGTIHFTDDPGTVPARFRKKTKQYNAEPIPQSLLLPDQAVRDKKPEPATVQPQLPATTQPTAPPQTAPAITKSSKFGERTADEWHRLFRTLRDQLKVVDQQLEQIKLEGGDGKTVLTRQKIDELNLRNKQLHEAHEALRLRFNRLVEEANAVGLPPEFGQ